MGIRHSGIRIQHSGQGFTDRRAGLQIDPVNHITALLLVGDDVRLPKNAEVVRGRGLRESDALGDLGDIARVLTSGLGREDTEDLQTHRIADRPELFSEGIEVQICFG